MKVKIKKLDPSAVIPTYAKPGDAGLDLTAISQVYFDDIDGLMYTEYGTGLSVEIPEGYLGLIFPRSSISKTDLTLANSVGVIDSGYRGEIKLRFKRSAEIAQYAEDHLEHPIRAEVIYDIGDKIGQLIILPYPYVTFEEGIDLTSTERGKGGFGSTDEKDK